MSQVLASLTTICRCSQRHEGTNIVSQLSLSAARKGLIPAETTASMPCCLSSTTIFFTAAAPWICALCSDDLSSASMDSITPVKSTTSLNLCLQDFPVTRLKYEYHDV